MTFTRKLLHVGATALMLSTAASVTTFMTADAAYAERGGNGNGQGRANRDRERPERGNGNGRGAIASELKWMNAAHANQNGLENANPNSRPGQLYIFQQESVEAAQADAAEADALTAFADSLVTDVEGETSPTEEELAMLTDDQIMEQYPDSIEAEDYILARAASEAADSEVDMLLDDLTDGEGLSDEALAELERLLRIAEIAAEPVVE